MIERTDFGDGLTWRKGTRSGGQGNDCVYVARRTDGMIGIRDSKQGTVGEPQWYADSEWDAFRAGVKAGEFDNL
jgi:hypothetical protein